MPRPPSTLLDRAVHSRRPGRRTTAVLLVVVFVAMPILIVTGITPRWSLRGLSRS
jgi:hypothetical protein